MKVSDLLKVLFFILILIFLSGCVSSFQRSIENLKPISYNEGYEVNLPYDFEKVVPLVREAMESKEANLVVQEEQELQDGSQVFFSRTTFMKMDFDPGAVVRVQVMRGEGQDKSTYLKVASRDLVINGAVAFKSRKDYAEIIAMKLDTAIKIAGIERLDPSETKQEQLNVALNATEIDKIDSPQKTLTAEEYFSEGSRYLDQEQDQKAYDAFTKAISLKPDYARAYLERGVTSYVMGNDARAATDFDRFVNLPKTDEDGIIDVMTAYIIGNTFYNSGQKERAKPYYEKWISYVLNNPNPTDMEMQFFGIASSRVDKK